jgi:hypothetical protein
MFLQNKIEEAAIAVITSSLSASGLNNWSIHSGLSNNDVTYPFVKVICNDFIPMYPELNIGFGKATLTIATCGIKADMTPAQFVSGSDIILTPFLANNIANTLTTKTTNVNIFGVYDAGLKVETFEDVWITAQHLEVVCARTS